MKLFKFIILAAIELSLAFSTLGFINFYPVAVTTLYIPVLIGAFYLGKWGGAAMGGVFGLVSMWKATNVSFTAADAFFSPFTSPDPWGSLIMSLGMRVLFGFCSGLIFSQVKKTKWFWPALIVATLVCSHLHSVFVLTAMGIFFPEMHMNMWSSFIRFFTLNSMAVNCLAAIVMTIVCYADRCTNLGNLVSTSLERLEKDALTGSNVMHMLLFLALMFVISSSLVIHFIDKVNLLLQEYGYGMTLRMQGIVEGWSIQFVISATAVSFLLFWIFIYFYEVSISSLNKSHIDSLTKLMNKDALEQSVNDLLADQQKPMGSFIMLDIDHFKNINDQFGHSAGDAILYKVARVLEAGLNESEMAGRLGGDEFCLYINGYITQDDLEQRVYELFMAIKQIELPDHSPLSCSIGATKGATAEGFQQFYSEADKALYLSKNKGRNGFSFYEK